jgi:hypothetical protein
MAFGPNFTGVHYEGENLVLDGVSDDNPPGDLLGVRVVLAQEEHIASGVAPEVGAGWHAPVTAAGFTAGAATAFGVESRRENATTVTWAQTVQIPEAPR